MTAAARTITLASGSVIRAAILKGAGVEFAVIRPDVDEAAIKRLALAGGKTLQETAQLLADEKARAVKAPGAIIASDQILNFEGQGFDKPSSMDEARQRLAALQGREHSLINAVTIMRDGEIAFRRVDEPRLLMRAMSASEIDAYLKAAGSEILASVGAYQVEGLGSRLFERIEGDYFAVLGLALHPVLGYLRREGFLAF
ncbi:MAG: nucleoside triphosphate pyrophosphatase [Parvularculaceae bacterium]